MFDPLDEAIKATIAIIFFVMFIALCMGLIIKMEQGRINVDTFAVCVTLLVIGGLFYTRKWVK